MEFFRSLISGSVQGLLWLFEGRHPMWSLVPISVLLGIGMLWVFGRVSNQKAIREAKRRLQANLYELRMFVDEPKLMFQAQSSLLRNNLRYLGLMLVPVAVLSVPLILLFVHLEAFYGVAPLQPGQAAVLTVRSGAPLQANAAAPFLQLPDGLVAETPPVRVMGHREISWRLRALKPVTGEVRLVTPDQSEVKSIAAGAGPLYLSTRRVQSPLELLLYPAEPQLPRGAIQWIQVDYPGVEVEWLGVRLHWIWWLLIISTVTALLLKRRFHVEF